MNPYIQSLVREHEEFFKTVNRKWKKSVKAYTGGEYEDINAGLRGTSDLSDVHRRHVENMDHVFELVPPITEPVTLFRGVGQREYIEVVISQQLMKKVQLKGLLSLAIVVV